MKTIRIQGEPFEIRAECEGLSRANSDIGALATFVGLVRPDGDLRALHIEHYPGMTEREIARHVAEAFDRWPLLGASILHRIGRLELGEPIVFVGVASSHRQAAFAACEFLMDYLKTRAPIWKAEERGTQLRWIDARPSDEAAATRWK